MKILLTLTSVLFLVSTTYTTNSYADEVSNHNDAGLSSGEMTNNIISVNVNGMVCDFCAQSIEKVFMKREEVKGINVNLDNQKVIIYLQKEANIDDTVIGTIFEDAGYSVEKITRKS
jgi:copper chaperone CopZ